MARLSQLVGPASNFTILASFSLITGMEITRSFGTGTLLIIGQAGINNDSSTDTVFAVQLVVDGVVIVGNFGRVTLRVGGRGAVVQIGLVAGSRGSHTIGLEVDGAGNAGEAVNAGNSRLIVVELPDWDDDANLVVL